jgi:hypothetical protein
MLDEYRRQYTDFNSAYMRENYLFFSGQKAAFEIASVYDRYADLFTSDSVIRLKQMLADTPEHFQTERVALRRLLSFAIEHFLEGSVKQLTEEISEYESSVTVDWQGREMTFQDLAIALATEKDRARRRDAAAKRGSVIEASNAIRAGRLSKLHDSSRSFGYESYTRLFEDLRGLSYQVIADEARSLLRRTEVVYLERLDEALRRDLGLKLEDAERSDAIYFQHLSSYDDKFPAHNLLRVYRETMASLGIDVDGQKNIVIDSEPRPRKTHRAFCLPISVPDDVKLVIRPSGGQADYQALLHEGGHAQHFGWASAELRPEFKYTGDYALTETYAFLLNHLISEGAWLTKFVAFRDNRDFIRSVMLARLVAVRRYSAKLIYENELHTGGEIARASGLYAELQTEATRFKTGPTDFLYDLDDSFYSASYLRAWAFEVMLREHLKTRFGQQWWGSRRAGAYLKDMWETGDRYNADEMASQVGIGPISFDPLVDEFNRALR